MARLFRTQMCCEMYTIKGTNVNTMAYIKVPEVFIVVQCISDNKEIRYFKAYVLTQGLVVD